MRSILTRTSGYLRGVTSHSLQPYRGCSFGRSLCGVGCYVQHNGFVTRGAEWGSFLEARTNAAELYRAQEGRERRWARRCRDGFRVFLSSSTDPFLPHERRFGVTRALLGAMREAPPDGLVVQTHSASVAEHGDALAALARRCALRVQISVESDRESLPGLPPPASSVEARLGAAGALRRAGLFTVVCVAPLLPIAFPRAFFGRIAEVADACVIDPFVGGDGTADGSRTRRTGLPAAMEEVRPGSTEPAYAERMARLARACLPGRVGVGAEGFAGRYA